MATKTLTDYMGWRYATKKMNPSIPVPAERVGAIIEQWDVTPASRKKDVVLQPLWQRPSQ